MIFQARLSFAAPTSHRQPLFFHPWPMIRRHSTGKRLASTIGRSHLRVDMSPSISVRIQEES
uniref:Uncharacterized protein n=1 Tax=Vitis vinifera TaxID=29760 RepID=F6HCU0_VITVI